MLRSILLTTLIALCAAADEWPGPVEGGYALPNGWRITPIGHTVPTEDLVMNIVPTPDGKCMVALHCGYNTHGLVVIDSETNESVQTIQLPSAFFGLTWKPDGSKLYVSGGNNKRENQIAEIHVFDYADGRLGDKPASAIATPFAQRETHWSGLVHHPAQELLYAANRFTGEVVAFDPNTGEVKGKVAVERQPYDLVLSKDAATLYCSNWASDTVSVIDTATLSVTQTIGVGDNPSDMLLADDGRLFVCCANDNLVIAIDTAKMRPTESIATTMYPRAPEGSTPNSLALDPEGEILYVANADNNNVCVIEIEEPGEATVLGFIPAGWYPSAVATSADGQKLYIGNAKGQGSYSNIRGPHSPLPDGDEGKGSVKSLMKGSINILEVPEHKPKLRELTHQVFANCPYNDDLLANARPPANKQTVVPSTVGAGSPIKHVIYIIKENRTYDQVFGDMPKGNGDPRLTIFGRDVTPNHHAIVEQFVLLDNIYCDAEVSVDGHQWSNAAYATDYVEKGWPASYGGKSEYIHSLASMPSAGYLWDQCARKGMTYRNYGEFARRISEEEDAEMTPVEGVANLVGHVAPNYRSWGARDYENAAEFIREFDEFEKNFDNPDPTKRLPNLIVMALPEDHTRGTTPGAPTPRAAVASNDYGLGLIVERVTNSRYWPELALFTIQDDAQDGPDHVDARRTVGLVVSPYCKRAALDSTLYTTSSMLRTIELLLGLQPMSQFDAAATPMYACFTDTPDLTPYTHHEPTIDLHETNQPTAWGADESLKMDFSLYDLAPMFALNEILWKSIKGPDSEMPLPIHRFQSASLTWNKKD